MKDKLLGQVQAASEIAYRLRLSMTTGRETSNMSEGEHCLVGANGEFCSGDRRGRGVSIFSKVGGTLLLGNIKQSRTNSHNSAPLK